MTRDLQLEPAAPSRATLSPPRNIDARPEAPLHVAFALGGTDLGRSGIGTYVREVLPPLIRRLKAGGGSLTAFGHPTELAAYAPALAGARQHPVRVTAKPGPNALWHLLRAGPLTRKLGADVLLLPAANRRLTARATIPTVAVVHDLAQLRVHQKYDRLRMFYFHQVLLRGFRTATQLVAVSRATRNDLVGALRLPADDVRVVYNGVNPEQFKGLDPSSAAVREVRRALGLETRPYFFYPARLEHPGKNHVRLLRAFAQSGLPASHTLALAGSDWGGGDLIRATIRELRLEDSVTFLGFVPTAQLPLLVSGADAVLMLGLHEGFGLPALEGLSAGKPVVVANTGALPEVVGDLGFQCDPLDELAIASALVRVVTDERMRARCRAEGPAWAEGFTWTRTANGLVDACHAAIATARR